MMSGCFLLVCGKVLGIPRSRGKFCLFSSGCCPSDSENSVPLESYYLDKGDKDTAAIGNVGEIPDAAELLLPHYLYR
jgi:hypothetical protein